MKRLKRVLGLALLVALAGCGSDRYELTGAGDGTVYKLDKKTGEVTAINSRYSYRVMSPEDTDRELAVQYPEEKRPAR